MRNVVKTQTVLQQTAKCANESLSKHLTLINQTVASVICTQDMQAWYAAMVCSRDLAHTDGLC